MVYHDPVISTVFGSRDEEEEGVVSIDIDDIDLEALAEEVVKLLKRELRLENERRGWHSIW